MRSLGYMLSELEHDHRPRWLAVTDLTLMYVLGPPLAVAGFAALMGAAAMYVAWDEVRGWVRGT